MTQELLETVEGGIATLTMNRPEARNALTLEMMDALLEARDRLPEGGAAAWRDRLAAAWENGASDAVGHLVA